MINQWTDLKLFSLLFQWLRLYLRLEDALVPAFVPELPAPIHVKKKVRFETPVPATKLRRNPRRTVWGSPPLSAILRPHLLGGVAVATTTTLLQPPCYRVALQNLPRQLSSQSESRLLFPYPVNIYTCIVVLSIYSIRFLAFYLFACALKYYDLSLILSFNKYVDYLMFL